MEKQNVFWYNYLYEVSPVHLELLAILKAKGRCTEEMKYILTGL